MKKIIEDNYLGYKLEIEVDSLNKEVTGKLLKVDNFEDFETCVEIYSATAVCHKEDKFNEMKGIKLVKLKLSRQVHADLKSLYGILVRQLRKALSDNEQHLNYHLKKLENIENTMKKDYEITFKKNKKVTKKNKKVKK